MSLTIPQASMPKYQHRPEDSRQRRKPAGPRNSPVAIVWRAPDRDNLVVKHELVTFHDELVRARDQVEVVGVHELLDDVGAEEEAGAAGREAPTFDVCEMGLEESA